MSLSRECKHEYPERMSRSCGAYVCVKCGEHKGLVRCFCGWSLSGRSGYQELLEMGECIEDDY